MTFEALAAALLLGLSIGLSAFAIASLLRRWSGAPGEPSGESGPADGSAP